MVNEIIRNIYSHKVVYGEDGSPREAFPASLPYDDGKALYTVVKTTGSRRTLEIGMAYGLSTLFIMQGLKENGGGGHVAIDPYQKTWWEDIGKLNVSRAGFGDEFCLLEAPSFEALPMLVTEREMFDFIFIDGNHRFDFTLVDFFYADRLLKPGGHVMLHDTWLPSIRKVLSFICRDLRETYEIAPPYNGEPRAGIAFWVAFFRTLRTAPFDILPAYFFAARRYKRYCVFKKCAALNSEKLDADWTYYRPF